MAIPYHHRHSRNNFWYTMYGLSVSTHLNFYRCNQGIIGLISIKQAKNCKNIISFFLA